MGLENSNSSQPPEPGPQPDNAASSSDAPLDSSLPSMMKSLTPNAPATSGDSAPQYPSLEAAVGIEQQVAPTLTNLLAAKPPVETNKMDLGASGMTIGAVTAVPMDSDLGPQAPPATVNNPAQHHDSEPDASWKALTQETAPTATPTEASVSAVTESAIEANPSRKEESSVASQEQSEAEALLSEALPAEESPAEELPAQTSETELQTQAKVVDREINAEVVGEETEADNDDFDQVKQGAAESDRTLQVLLKREETHVAVIFPEEEEVNANPDIDVDFIDSQLWQDLQQRLSGGTDFASNTPVHLYSQNCLLDTRQLQELDEALGRFNLKLSRIITSRRQTAVAAAMSGYSADQTNNLPELLSKEVYSPQKIGLAEPLYLQKNIRSGTEIRHPGSVIVMGDLNPGSSVIADGDILVWGRLRGIAHAGAAGNKTSIVMALKLEAPQLRIAGAVARVDAQSKDNPSPEIAYISDKGIRITSAYGFNRNALA